MRKSYVIFGLIIVVLGLMPVVSAMSEVSSSSGELGVGVTLMTDEYLVKVECVVDEELLKEYDLLVAEMNDLDPTSSVEEVKAMIDKVSAIEDKIAKIKMLCEPVEKVVLPSVAVSQEMDVVAPSSTGGGSGGSSSSSPSAIPSSEAPTTVSSGGSVVIGEPILLKEFMIQSSVSGLVFRCSDLKSYDEKYAYYEKLYSLSDKELKDMGYLDRKDIEKILDEISDGIKMLESVCGNSEVVPSVEISNVAISVAKPIVASSGVEIKDYYRAKIESISSSDDVDEQIEDLKSLRTEIDGLIEELIKSKDVISTDDMDSIVSEINVRPGVIEA
ncbi:MAG: hypothetical protein KAJ47_03845, partial [Candidatus Aenigmarchaeota archaeon]|nr:hypothetical protein [Candidatus Aenigmarchaeota archaeon]